jgi:glycosyltransferase involved in cell wall biosynthesis
MKIKLVSSSLNGRVTGLSRYSRTLSQYLMQADIDVQTTIPDMPMPRPLVAVGHRLGWDVGTFFRSYPVFGKVRDADLYHFDSENLASLLAFAPPQPSVVTVHAFFSYFLRHDPELAVYRHIIHEWFDTLAARGLRRAQAIIAVSNYVRDLLLERLDLPPDRVHVIHEAVDHNFFYPQHVTDSFRRKHELSPDCQYVLYAGSEQPRKNFLTLVRAFARVSSELPNTRLLKVGQPEYQSERKKAEKLIRQLNIEQKVVFLGHVNAELPLFYCASDVFVFPSRYEGFGFPPLEAMACGTPVICTNTSSLPEVVGNAALSFDPVDEDQLVEHLVGLLTDAGIRNVYRQKGLRRAATFSWAETARKTIEVYEQLAG